MEAGAQLVEIVGTCPEAGPPSPIEAGFGGWHFAAVAVVETRLFALILTFAGGEWSVLAEALTNREARTALDALETFFTDVSALTGGWHVEPLGNGVVVSKGDAAFAFHAAPAAELQGRKAARVETPAPL